MSKLVITDHATSYTTTIGPNSALQFRQSELLIPCLIRSLHCTYCIADFGLDIKMKINQLARAEMAGIPPVVRSGQKPENERERGWGLFSLRFDTIDKDLNYDNLASGLKQALENDKTVFDADRLQKYTGPELRELLKWPRPLPLEDERVRLLHEVGFELERSFGGKASNIVESCDKSAVKLVSMIARHFPGFRDHTVYKGHQVFLYKRAQIFAADVWGAFKGEGYGEFSDVGSITIFADYIAPAVLQQLGVFRYSSDLDNIIKGNKEIGSGTEEEVELRACSIYAVEKMRDLIQKRTGKQVLSVELDLWLWAYGVSNPSLQHHRTLSIYY
ncbi:uncharacterized protein LOC143616256 [Bidens hawaiensis]|uniref:uncharacterized protein LOC143616256 n=1 Tax=Bidens hawaiensis TaxID=980011 RepID=UPI004049079C